MDEDPPPLKVWLVDSVELKDSRLPMLDFIVAELVDCVSLELVLVVETVVEGVFIVLETIVELAEEDTEVMKSLE